MKKFGKKVQVEKIKERHAQKRMELEKVNIAKKKNNEDVSLFKKRKSSEDGDFDVQVDQDVSYKKSQPKKSSKRQKRDDRFGFGGRKRNMKSNTAESTDDLNAKVGGYNVKKMKTGMRPKKKQRPGKSKRMANRK
jgi:rRNA-processing protein EBP2